jgi:anti-sigma-K factor RskA
LTTLSAKAAHAQQLADVLNAPSAQRVTLTLAKHPADPTGHAIYLPDRGALLFEANNLQPLNPGKTYELWVIPANGTAPVPAGVFKPNASGYASVVLPQLPPGIAAKAFGVTIENDPGASTPTMPIVLAGG